MYIIDHYVRVLDNPRSGNTETVYGGFLIEGHDQERVRKKKEEEDRQRPR